MNIQVQICGMFVLILLFVFYRSHKTLHLYTEKVFYRTLCVALLNLSMDIMSLVMIQFRQQIPIMIVNGVCKLYLVSLIWEGLFALCYVLTDLFSQEKHTHLTRVITGLTAVQSLIVFALPIYIFDNGKQVYTYGAAVSCVYGFVILYIAAILVAIIVFHKKLNSRRAFAVGIWMFVWISAAVIQFLNSSLLVVGFASAIGILILFVIMENPEANLDRKLGCFNSYALSEYLKQLIERKQQYGVLEISFGDSGMPENDGSIHMDAVLRKVISLVDKYTDSYMFKNIYSDIAIVSQDVEQLRTIGKEILDILSDYDIFQKDTTAVLVTRGDAFLNVDELLYFFSFVRTKYVVDSGKIFPADEEVIRKYKEKHLIEQEIGGGVGTRPDRSIFATYLF